MNAAFLVLLALFLDTQPIGQWVLDERSDGCLVRRLDSDGTHLSVGINPDLGENVALFMNNRSWRRFPRNANAVVQFDEHPHWDLKAISDDQSEDAGFVVIAPLGPMNSRTFIGELGVSKIVTVTVAGIKVGNFELGASMEAASTLLQCATAKI